MKFTSAFSSTFSIIYLFKSYKHVYVKIFSHIHLKVQKMLTVHKEWSDLFNHFQWYKYSKSYKHHTGVTLIGENYLDKAVI